MASHRRQYRRRIAVEQRCCCFYCNQTFDTYQGVPPSMGGVPIYFVLDHLYPRSKGGLDGRINRVASCKPCDARKRDRLPTDAELAKQAGILKRTQGLKWSDLILESEDA